MTLALLVLVFLVSAGVAFWGLYTPPEPPPNRLGYRLWQAKSVWRERK